MGDSVNLKAGRQLAAQAVPKKESEPDLGRDRASDGVVLAARLVRAEAEVKASKSRTPSVTFTEVPGRNVAPDAFIPDATGEARSGKQTSPTTD